MNKGLGDTIHNMKTFVKLIIFIFLVQTLLSCESSSEVGASCECDKYTQVRYITIQSGSVTSDTGFQDNGSKEYQ